MVNRMLYCRAKIESASGKMKVNHITTLDAVRFAAALWVLSFHYTATEFVTAAAPFTKYGFLGVPLFFMISGYVIALSLASSSSPQRFLVNRLFRLYPAFVVCSVITIVYVAVFSGMPHFTLKEIALNATMMGEGLNIRLINGAYWSLTVEWLFYLMMAGVFATIGVRRLSVFLWLWLALSVFQIFFDVSLLKKLFVLRYAPFFVGGASFYLIAHSDRKALSHWLLCVVSFPVSCYWAIEKAQGIPDVGTFNFFAMIACVAAFYMLMGNLGRTPDFLSRHKGFFGLAGRTSYPLYLIHETIGVDILNKFNMHGLAGAGFILAITVAAVCVAIVISEYIERPVIALLKRSVALHRPTPSVT
ncbi:acyltransferase family protein [Paraburkholderia acidisoli]|uniref:Acyltransferase family protein n=1 Tax=Paraburkholderia acidisoli TaxID=2571748 RepID=A0A7Z2GF87_9BURK|nr:acyltransferase [Paraburkholderia acidisoli]QGZ60707.1 acyltransferase family protein [Paraburkholderia acidisoli]